MSPLAFTVTEHTSPCSFIRQFPHGAKRDEAVLQLAVKEYRPRHQNLSAHDSVTIIATHGNGFPKECFEPLWDDLLQACNGVTIDSIWVADMANQGASYGLNAEELGDDPSWIDHSLDLLLMINTFRHRMKPPFIGLAHSMGCGQLVYLSSIHPRLFQSLILIEPILQTSHPPGPNAALFSSKRRAYWPSRETASTQIRNNGFFQSMDPRALDVYVEYALTDTPNGNGVQLTTPKAQEAWTYIRSNFHELSKDTKEGRQRERMMTPHIVPLSTPGRLVTMSPELLLICAALPFLQPRVFFLYGDYSHFNFEEVRESHLAQTGTGKSETGRGGNGGMADGGVEMNVVEDAGHLCVFEKPGVIAGDVAVWLGKEVKRWNEEKMFWGSVDTGKSKDGRRELSDKWLRVVKEETEIERPVADGKSKL